MHLFVTINNVSELRQQQNWSVEKARRIDWGSLFVCHKSQVSIFVINRQ